ncbi:metal-sensitive transcriptional repressor [Bacteriovorax sp. BSW11_IV]|uniref:metal-sensitive transcriptional regulator n=1 Tax=Bacteriovorax sp. BSW11_IV TaxID=1353529 RepID=UPI00038A2BBA|nr:metal-sensitive transcriptional regulator [Bacteriovorax sp. BSW11_IV]EQC42961.1 metal-sensitive transcriptional repressor [Bacteriovorax sp. BSW11_IV]
MAHHADHKKVVNRLKRVEGQVRGLVQMVEGEKYCMDILTQIKAARSALKSIELEILEGHVDHCVQHAIESNDRKEAKKKMDEIMELLRRSSK